MRALDDLRPAGVGGEVKVFGLSESQIRVDSVKGQNRTLRPLSALWPPVFAGEQDVGPPKG